MTSDSDQFLALNPLPTLSQIIDDLLAAELTLDAALPPDQLFPPLLIRLNGVEAACYFVHLDGDRIILEAR